MSSRHTTQEEIAKQFDLPERQSKIESLLREPEIYCICRSSDSTRFMIACDACEEWYHGDCVNVTQSDAKDIHHYYCQWCIEKDPSLEIEYKKKSGSSSHSKDKSHKAEKKGGRPKKTTTVGKSREPEEKVVKFRGCGSCSGCLNKRDCGRCEICKKNRKAKDSDKCKKKICLKRVCVEQLPHKIKEAASKQESSSSILAAKQLNVKEEDDWVPAPPAAATTTKKQKSSRRSKKKADTKSRKQYTPKDSDHSGSSDEDAKGEDVRQCYWYECVKPARSGSKYCSDECGIRLATDRIFRLLPGRIQEWNLTPSLAEEKNKKDLEEIRRKQEFCRTSLVDLENKRIALDAHIDTVQKIEINPDADEEEQEEEEGSIPCVTCGHEVSVKTCIKHMERCYNKYESQTSFGSAFKTGLDGTPIFCDFYHAANRTYCKRLKVLCPEHSKEPKIRETAICGYPQILVVKGPTPKFCRLPKKKCNRHHCWEKLRRAEIDLEKVRYWLKLDELLEQERQCKQALTNRAGVLGLLLHSTFDHELRERIQKQMAEAELKQKMEEEERQRQEELERRERMDQDMLINIDDDFEMQNPPRPTKSRGHRKSNPKKPESSTAEMTASKLYKLSRQAN